MNKFFEADTGIHKLGNEKCPWTILDSPSHMHRQRLCRQPGMFPWGVMLTLLSTHTLSTAIAVSKRLTLNIAQNIDTTSSHLAPHPAEGQHHCHTCRTKVNSTTAVCTERSSDKCHLTMFNLPSESTAALIGVSIRPGPARPGPTVGSIRGEQQKEKGGKKTTPPRWVATGFAGSGSRLAI